MNGNIIFKEIASYIHNYFENRPTNTMSSVPQDISIDNCWYCYNSSCRILWNGTGNVYFGTPRSNQPITTLYRMLDHRFHYLWFIYAVINFMRHFFGLALYMLSCYQLYGLLWVYFWLFAFADVLTTRLLSLINVSNTRSVGDRRLSSNHA